jgi:hypothetical protein
MVAAQRTQQLYVRSSRTPSSSSMTPSYSEGCLKDYVRSFSWQSTPTPLHATNEVASMLFSCSCMRTTQDSWCCFVLAGLHHSPNGNLDLLQYCRRATRWGPGSRQRCSSNSI